jgi:hypothetical protein
MRPKTKREKESAAEINRSVAEDGSHRVLRITRLSGPTLGDLGSLHVSHNGSVFSPAEPGLVRWTRCANQFFDHFRWLFVFT